MFMQPAAAVLMCHAPIVIPEIAGEHANAVGATTRAMDRAARWISGSGAEFVLVVSPHTPRHRRSFVISANPSLTGSFRDFGSPMELSFRGAPEVVSEMIDLAERSCRGLAPGVLRTLDHGALVPLYFLARAGWEKPVIVLAPPMESEVIDCEQLGAWLSANVQAKWALVASGDMSHRLLPGAPAGYHPRGKEFDSLVFESVRTGNLAQALNVPQELRELAAEDVIDSLALAAGALGSRVLCAEPDAAYEGPFGVGYLVSKLRRNAA